MFTTAKLCGCTKVQRGAPRPAGLERALRLRDVLREGLEVRRELRNLSKSPLFIGFFTTRRGGHFTESQPACLVFSKILRIFAKDLRDSSKILHNTKTYHFENYLRFAAIPAKFYENRGEGRSWNRAG